MVVALFLVELRLSEEEEVRLEVELLLVRPVVESEEVGWSKEEKAGGLYLIGWKVDDGGGDCEG